MPPTDRGRTGRLGVEPGGESGHALLKGETMTTEDKQPVCDYCGCPIHDDECVITDVDGEPIHMSCASERQDGDDLCNE